MYVVNVCKEKNYTYCDLPAVTTERMTTVNEGQYCYCR